MARPEPLFDRELLNRRRQRAARLGAAAIAAGRRPPEFLLERVADDIIWRLAAVKRRFAQALVLGGHHGLLTRKLAHVPSVDNVVEAGSSAELIAAIGDDAADATVKRLVADEEALPFAEASCDLIVSALSLQWVNDLTGTLIQIRRTLRPDGLMIAALMGGRTLNELREAFLVAEAEVEGGASPRVAPFADVRDLGALLQRARFALPVTDVDTLDVTYADPLALMLELRAMGAGNVLAQRSRKPLRRATLARAIEIYRERHGTPEGRVRATFEIVTLTGWAPHESQQKPLAPGSAKTRLADVLGTREHKLNDEKGN